MPTLFIAGETHLQTTVHIDRFPLDYVPSRRGSALMLAGGAGYAMARALAALRAEVRLASVVGRDMAAGFIRSDLAAAGVDVRGLRDDMAETAHVVALRDGEGRVSHLIDDKDAALAYPPEACAALLDGCDLAVVSAGDLTRGLLPAIKQAGVPLLVDVGQITDPDEPASKEFIAAADIVCLSGAYLAVKPDVWAAHVWAQYRSPLMVIDMGEDGAYLAERETAAVTPVPAVYTRPVVDRSGGAHALAAAFAHGYLMGGDPLAALRKAVVFASYKAGAVGADAGLLDPVGLDVLYGQFSARDGDG